MKIKNNEREFRIAVGSEKNIFLKLKNQLVALPIVNGKVTISFEKIYELSDGLPSILCLVNEDKKEIFQIGSETQSGFIDLLDNSKACFLYNDTVISLYLSKDSYLRILVGELPVSNRFLEHTELNSVEQLNDDQIKIGIDFYTHFSNVSKSNLYFTFRGTLERISVSSRDVLICDPDVERDNLFKTRVYYILHASEIETVRHIDGYSNYFNNILDLSVEFQLESNYLVERRHRVSLESDYQEYFVLPNTVIACGLKFYPTLNEKSSIIMEDIPLESVELLSLKATHSAGDERKIVLFCEYPEKAQDTAFSQFSYMVENYSDQFDCYYIIDKNSPDLINLEKYKNQVLFYKSPDHFKLFMKADILFHSHSAMYASPVKKKSFQDKQDSIFKVFLQHGVLGVRDLSSMYAKGDRIFTNLFICSSEREKAIIINDYGYEEDEVALTGLARFDNLFLKYNDFMENRTGTERYLLIFPSWRKGQNRLSDEKFMETRFYNEFQELINDPQFIELLKKNNIKAKFILHPNFNHYSHLFTSDYVETNIKNFILQDELVENDFLLTDFSSAALDFALLKKIVIYYQFDKKLVETKKDNNLKKFLPGKIIYTRPRLYKYLEKSFNKKMPRKKYLKRLTNLYSFEDTNSRERIIENTVKRMNEKN